MFNRIELPLQPSLKAGGIAAAPWLALTLVLAALSIYLHPLFLLATVPAMAGAWRRWQRCGNLRHPQAIVRLTVSNDTLTGTLRDQRELTLTVNRDSRLTGKLAILALRHDHRGWPCPVILCSPGNVRDDDFRRMRVWLRLASRDPESPAQTARFSDTLKQRLSLTKVR